MQRGAQIIDRQILVAHDLVAAELNFGIDAVPAFGLEWLDRQYLVGRLQRRHIAPGLAGIRVGTDQRRQVVELQQLRGHHAFQQWTRSFGRILRLVFQRPGQIAAADLAAEFFIDPVAAAAVRVAVQAAFGRERRCLRQHDAGQRIQLRHAGTGQLQAQIQRRQLARLG